MLSETRLSAWRSLRPLFPGRETLVAAPHRLTASLKEKAFGTEVGEIRDFLNTLESADQQTQRPKAFPTRGQKNGP
jgi:hypothetical protein